MSAATSQSSPAAPLATAQRASGAGRIALKAGADGKSKLDRLYQFGCAKVRLPKVYSSQAAEAVLINSSGGLTGGDEMTWDITCGAGTHGVMTTQACEKTYKSDGGVAHVTTTIKVADGARCDWLPQETILFNRSGLKRSLNVELNGLCTFSRSRSLAPRAARNGRSGARCLLR